MSPSHVYNKHDEQRQFAFRVAVLSSVLFIAMLGVAGRYFYLQVIHHQDYVTDSENNRIRVLPIAPARGLIKDRKGRILADNRPAFKLQMIPELVKDLDAQLIALAEVIHFTANDASRLKKVLSNYHSFDAVPVKLKLSEQDVAQFSVQQYRFPGFEVAAYQSRYYPYADLFAHVIGYVGQLDVKDLKRLDKSRYKATSHTGKVGLEWSEEKNLQGYPGLRKVETNVQGRIVNVIERQAAIAGKDEILTLDLLLQRASQKALGDVPGAVVVIDLKSQGVLSLVSNPSYDPNMFVRGLSNKEYKQLIEAAGKPLFDRALKGQYEPGSTVKPFMGIIGLEDGVVDVNEKMDSIGYYQLPDVSRKYRDWRKGGHGRINLVGAIEQSVNTYFYETANRLGIDRMDAGLEQFGFGIKTGIELPGERLGIRPSKVWKMQELKQGWYPGEVIIAGIGQGFFVTTPIQLARAVSILALRGQNVRPHILKDSPPAKGMAYSAREEHWKAVEKGMYAVVNGSRGTARAVGKGLDFKVAGKTGTAQVYGLADEEEQRVDKLAPGLRNHALFIAYAPAEKPEVVVTVVVEHGGSGSGVAAPVAKKVLQAWWKLNKEGEFSSPALSEQIKKVAHVE